MAYQRYSGVFTNTQAAQAKGQDKWVSTSLVIPGDDEIANTTLLLQANGSDGDTNNGFIDSSDNTHTITRNGNVTQGSFSPFSQDEGKWGNSFDGSGDYLQMADSDDFHIGASDFTLEGWIYKEDKGSWSSLIGQRAGGSSEWRIVLDFNATSYDEGVFRFDWGAGALIWSSANILNNSWTHFALVRSGTTGTLYINGTSVGTNTLNDVSNFSAPVRIGTNDGSGEYYLGYISNLRLVKGTAVYTSNFTPSTEPLTSISGTSLLTCQSNRFVDNSSNAHSITVNGDPEVAPFSPFAPDYDPATKGGSGYFDGNDRLFNSSGANVIDFGTGNFTVEMWVNLDTNTTVNQMLIEGPSDTGFQFYVQNDSGGTLYAGKSGVSVSVSYVLPSSFDNSWNHIAYVREGTGTNQATLYVNGVAVSTGTDSGNYTETGFQLSRASSYVINGYISNVRVVKGTAVYTSAFTPPTTPLTNITNTSLLCNFTNAGIYDGTGRNVLETVGDAQVDTAVKKFGTGSMKFDGTGDYLLVPGNDQVEFGSGDFTIECWVNISAASAYGGIVSKGTPSTLNSTTWALEFNNNANTISWYVNAANGVYIINGSQNIKTSTWIHVAVTKSGTNTKLFVNGVQDGSTYATGYDIASGGSLYIGGGFYAPSTRSITGYIDDLRITKGVARYTANFTPPTTEFPAIATVTEVI